MTDWSSFPTIRITPDTQLWRIHNVENHPAYFNDSNAWRFGPPPTHKGKFGTCYLGLGDPRPAYVEKYSRTGVITPQMRDRDGLSELTVPSPVDLADLTDRSVFVNFGVTASHSTGSDYGPSQELAAAPFNASIGGVRYRISRDPRMELEAVALFGEPGEHPERFNPPKTTNPIPDDLIDLCREFGIDEVPNPLLL
ncbi:MAG: RES domain-containing protein [Acidimicrobiia bacterium]|nr:RES domain-containing protein [Acidimicrobiia bacterium]